MSSQAEIVVLTCHRIHELVVEHVAADEDFKRSAFAPRTGLLGELMLIVEIGSSAAQLGFFDSLTEDVDPMAVFNNRLEGYFYKFGVDLGDQYRRSTRKDGGRRRTRFNPRPGGRGWAASGWSGGRPRRAARPGAPGCSRARRAP
jgi:hypothetical protein